MKKYTKEGLIKVLQLLANDIGKTPTIKDLIKRKNCPSYFTFYNYFGSWNNALKSANLEINYEYKFYSNQELVDFLTKFWKRNNKVPRLEDFVGDNNYPSPKTYFQRFGSWNNALKRANLEINMRKDYKREELIGLLRNKAKDLGRSPTIDELNIDKNMPDRDTYSRYFGTFNKALGYAGLEVRYVFRKWTKEELLQKLQQKAKEIGKCPTQKNLDRDSAMPAKNSYRKYFGSFNNAVRNARLYVNYNISKEELIKILQELYLKLNRTPTREDLKHENGCPSLTPFVEKFGSYTAACLRAGLVPNDGRNNYIWKAWQKNCEEMAKVIYGYVAVQFKDDEIGIPDIYVPNEELFIEVKTCGYKDFKGQIRRYCLNGQRLEFWCIFKGIETKNDKVKYIYAEELAKRMKTLGREDLSAKCYQFIKNVFDEEQKVLV